MNEGVYCTIGGNPSIAKGFHEFFKELGGVSYFGTRVKEILVKDRKARGVILQNDDTLEADDVIVNGDFITATKNLIKEADRPSFPDSKLNSYEPSISAFVILAGVRDYQKSIHHHQVFFSSDYQREFQEIFIKKQLPSDPTIYISHSAATEPNITKGSNLFILVNAPAIEMENEKIVQDYKEKIYHSEKHGVHIRESMEVEKVFTPTTIKTKFSSYKGALYGLSSSNVRSLSSSL